VGFANPVVSGVAQTSRSRDFTVKVGHPPERFSGSNPHFEFFDSSTHAYDLIEVTPTELICTMVEVDTTQEPRSNKNRLARFQVPAGRVEINRIDLARSQGEEADG
jgi:hypothetical protein